MRVTMATVRAPLAVPPITEGESSIRLDRKVVTGGVGGRLWHLIASLSVQQVRQGRMDDVGSALVET